MKNFILFGLFLLSTNFCLGVEIYDAKWCILNGGKIEFKFNHDINFNCITNDITSPTYIEKIYNIVCIPYLSSITNNENPLFLKIVGNYQNSKTSILDDYNFKITENELIRYI